MIRLIITCIVLVLLTPGPLLCTLLPDGSAAPVVQTPEKTIAQSQLSLEESMADLSRIFGVKIEVTEKSGSVSDKFNLNLELATLEQAVKEAIRKAGLRNHALVWNEPDRTLRILIFEKGDNESMIDNSRQNAKTEDLFNRGNTNSLTHEQLYLLAQQNENLANEEEYQPLTQEQLQRLKKQSAEIESEEQAIRKPLADEQILKLQERSAEIESEEHIGIKLLTADKMNKLQAQSAELESEEKESMKPLTREQMLLLHKLETQQ